MPANRYFEVVSVSYLQSLSVFWTVVDEGSFSSAAKRLALTQPTISFHIDNLEKQFGCQLFTRTAKGVSPTVYGQTLYESTTEMRALAKRSENQLRSLVEGKAGHLRIGASTIPAHYILPQIIGDFLLSRPEMTVSLAAGDSSNILRQFENGELPIAIIGFLPSTRYSLPVFHDELILVAHPEYPVPDGASNTCLLSLPLIVREPSSGSRRTLAEQLNTHGIPWSTLNIVVQAGGNEACRELILKKVGIGFLSRKAITADLRAGKLRRLDLPGINLTRTFYALAAEPLLPAGIAAFWQFMLEYKFPE